jgi:hypothetical protein
MSDARDPSFRTALLGSIGFLVGGILLLATGSGAPAVGWLAVAFGLVGLVVCAGVRLGWITPGRAPGTATARRAAPLPAAGGPPPLSPVVPELSGPGRDRVAEIVAALHAAGVLAPRAPDPADLYEPVADYGEPVTVDAVLGALHEAAYYNPGFRAEEYRARLAFHDSHAEQDADVLRAQVRDLAGLVGGAVSVLDVRLSFAADGAAADRAVIRLSVDGREQTLEYAPAPKYLSTVLHVALAHALRAAVPASRLAWLWCDQGVWITALPERGPERLNAALGLDATDPNRWEWVDEQDPVAAGRRLP